jgi:hypothetical protein
LTAHFADDDPDGAATAVSYQWKRGGVSIGGATASTRVLAAADVGSVMTVAVTYTDAQGFSATLTSAGTVGGRGLQRR